MKRSTAGLLVGIAALPVATALWVVLSGNATSIEDLIAPATRLRTYHRLWVNSETGEEEVFKPLRRYSNFEQDHEAIHLFRIPVPKDPEHPLYLILRKQRYGSYTADPPWKSRATAFDGSSWKSWLFPPRHPVSVPPLRDADPLPLDADYILSLHSEDGSLLDDGPPRPFHGNNVTEKGEVIHDINRDGWVERVGAYHFGVSDPKGSGEILEITRIDRQTTTIFNLLFNAGDDEPAKEWGYACRDLDGDGTLEIEIGKRDGGTLSPEVVFRWNAASGSYESASGTAGQHFRVLPTNDLWKTLETLAREGKLSYPLDR
jgi:hypothetical protein